MVSKIEQITAAETQIDTMVQNERSMRAEAMADGTIDSTEQASLDRIKGKIDQLRDAVQKLRTEWEENKRIWESRAGDFGQLNGQLDELRAWEHIDYSALESGIDEVAAAEAEQDFAGATALLDSAIASMDPVYQEYQRQSAAKDQYEQIWSALQPRLDASAQCEYAALTPVQEQIIAGQAQVENAVMNRDYVVAVEAAESLAAHVDEFEARFAEIEEQRAEYQAGRAALDPRITEYSVSRPEWTYIEAKLGQLADLLTATDALVTVGDFAGALASLTEVEGAIDAIDTAIADKQAEYETQRADFDARMTAVQATTYVDLAALRDGLAANIGPIDQAAAAGDWQTALDLVGQGLVDLDSFDAAVTEQEDLERLIKGRLPALKTELGTFTDVTSSVKTTATARVASIEGALAGRSSLTEAARNIDTLVAELNELAEIKRIGALLNAADPADLDDVSRQIVDDMKAAGTLDTLPTELRTTLVDNMMAGTPTDDEHAAIQEIFSLPHVDRQFEEMDSQTRQSIVNAYMNDPEVQELAENWATMDPAARQAAVAKLIEVPCGEDGWDVGTPGTITPFDTPFSNAPGAENLYGAYSHSNDEMTFNTNDDAHGDFGEVLDTITHEMGHRYQMQLIERLDPSHPDALSPGDPEYEQARWLQQDDNYFNNHHDEFDNIYFTSPSETHSRVMGNEVKEGLREGFDLPEEEDDDGGGGDGHSH